MDVKMKKLLVENLVKVERIMETSYENNTCWIEYRVGENLGYEISEGLQEGDEEMLQSWIDDEKFNVSAMAEKKNISECSKYLAEIIEECRESENEMWFVEEDEITEEEAMKISDEVERLGIEDYVRFYEDGCAITIYGGVITRFLF